jgi:hypothetical protein
MQTIIDFIIGLPPLLQLLAGIFGTLGILKALMLVADYIEDKREGKS